MARNSNLPPYFVNKGHKESIKSKKSFQLLVWWQNFEISLQVERNVRSGHPCQVVNMDPTEHISGGCPLI